MSTQSKACCSIPPVVSDGYKEKGEWITINGMKTYTTGPKDAKSALLVVYDIFGFFPQTLQGADLLAHSDKDHQYQVFMPGKCFCSRFLRVRDVMHQFAEVETGQEHYGCCLSLRVLVSASEAAELNAQTQLLVTSLTLAAIQYRDDC